MPSGDVAACSTLFKIGMLTGLRALAEGEGPRGGS